MTAASKATALGFLVATFVAVPVARAQLQPPPFAAPAHAVPAPPPPPPAAPPPAAPPPPAPPPPAPPPAAARRSQPAAPPAAADAAIDDPKVTRGDEEAIDDPKVSRRLGTRISVPPPSRPSPPVASPRPAPVSRPALAVPPAPSPPPAPTPAPARASAAAPAPVEVGDIPAIERPYTPPAETTFEPTLPRLKLGLRRFEFVQLGASNTPAGLAARESFNNFSVDVYPVSRLVRIGLTSAFGWQSGTWLSDGDYFATQTVSLGLQYRDLGRIVPFIEGFGGVGYMRRLQFDRTIPTAFWQFGIDAGMEIYVARVGYLSLALGYLRPINGFAKRQQFTSVYVDTWSFKLGIGI
jgi:hypothetical protein